MSPKARVSLKGDRALKPKLQKLKTLHDLPVRKHQFPQGIGTENHAGFRIVGLW